MKNKILTGIDEDLITHYINIETIRGYYSITHESIREFITEDQGWERAKEHLKYGDIWKQSVQEDRTTYDINEWVEEVLNTDGWKGVLDVQEFTTFENEVYYSCWDSFGASVECLTKNYIYEVLTNEQKELLIKSDILHLKDLKNFNKEDKKLFNEVCVFLNNLNQNEKELKVEIIKEILKNY